MRRCYEFLRAVAFWAEDQLDWLFRNAVFPVQIVLLLFASWGLLGAELGIERLFWSEMWHVQFGCGLAIGMQFGMVLFVWYLLDKPQRALALVSRHSWPSLFPSKKNDDLRRLGSYLLWALLFLLSVIIVGKAVVVVSSDVPRLRTYLTGRHYFLYGIAGYALSLVLAWLLYVFDERLGIREAIARWSLFRSHPGFRTGRIPEADIPLHAISAYLVIAGLLFLAGATVIVMLLNEIDPGRVAMSPVVLACLVFILITQVYGYWVCHLQVGTLTVIVLALALAIWNSSTVFPEAAYKVQFPGLDDYYPCGSRVNLGTLKPNSGWPENGAEVLPGEIAPGKPRELLKDADILARMSQRWQDARKSTRQAEDGEPRPKLIVIAVSGGGIRSAVWTGVILEGLDQGMPGGPGRAAFRDHIRLFTGASGGMVGASLFVADHERDWPDRGKPAPSEDDRKIGLGPIAGTVAQQSLLPTIQTAVLRDFSRNLFVPPWCPVAYDRGRALEDKWMLNARAHGFGPPGKKASELEALLAAGRKLSPFNRTFADLYELEADGKRPSIIFSPMLVEDSRRLLISNLDLRKLAVASGPVARKPEEAGYRLDGQYSRSGLEFFKLFPRSHSTFQVGTAARMSATFPVVSPAVSLPTVPARRVVDAGYFDNYGVDLAVMWLVQNRMDLLKHCGGVALVEIRAFALQDRGLAFYEGGDPEHAESAGLLADAFAAISTPLRAVLRARGNSSYHRNNELLAALDHAFNTNLEVDDPFFRRFVFELDTDASLNWYLSSEEKKGIAGWFRTEDVQNQARALAEWLGDGGGKLRQ